MIIHYCSFQSPESEVLRRSTTRRHVIFKLLEKRRIKIYDEEKKTVKPRSVNNCKFM